MIRLFPSPTRLNFTSYVRDYLARARTTVRWVDLSQRNPIKSAISHNDPL
jgi:hypothetical protein